MMKESIIVATDTLYMAVSETQQILVKESILWQWIAYVLIFVCVIGLIVILKLIKKNPKIVDNTTNISNARKQNDAPIDFENIMNSAFLSADLYDKLKVKCHPDRFASYPDKQSIAEDIFQRLTQNKANYKVLQQIKKEAEETLKIKI